MKLFVKSFLAFFIADLFLAGCSFKQDKKRTESIYPVSIDGLIEKISTNQSFTFQSESTIKGASGEKRELMSFISDELKQYALVLWPSGETPKRGWPVLILNHGYHPRPLEYGIFPDGNVSRPGAYYWDLAQAYVDHGYVVVIPDYRGHNSSDGFEYTQSKLASHWYTRDVLAAYFATIKLSNVNIENIYMLGHSMGAGITQRALIVLGNRIKAASIWSTVGESSWRNQFNLLVEESNWFNMPSPYALSALDQIESLQTPLAIHHAEKDKTTPIDGALELVERLSIYRKQFHFYRYQSDQHLFTDEDFDMAVMRDIEWFKSH